MHFPFIICFNKLFGYIICKTVNFDILSFSQPFEFNSPLNFMIYGIEPLIILLPFMSRKTILFLAYES